MVTKQKKIKATQNWTRCNKSKRTGWYLRTSEARSVYRCYVCTFTQFQWLHRDGGRMHRDTPRVKWTNGLRPQWHVSVCCKRQSALPLNCYATAIACKIINTTTTSPNNRKVTVWLCQRYESETKWPTRDANGRRRWDILLIMLYKWKKLKTKSPKCDCEYIFNRQWSGGLAKPPLMGTRWR